MKKAFEITDQELITEILQTAEYGVLALSGKQPYAVPVNFVYLEGDLYFHGSLKGKKMTLLRENNRVSFNVTTDATIIPSYFSSSENLACPASSFFKSIIIDGHADIVENRGEVAKVFLAMMKKLQPEGKYTSFESNEYDPHFKALSVVKIKTQEISAKFKMGQNLNQERFQMIIEHLQRRGRKIDRLTANSMKKFYKL